MSLTPGTRLGPYEVTAQIGVGGMGEVYISVGKGKIVLAARYVAGAGTYDVSPDGQRFLMIKDAGAQVVVVQNWLEELRSRVPSRK